MSAPQEAERLLVEKDVEVRSWPQPSWRLPLAVTLLAMGALCVWTWQQGATPALRQSHGLKFEELVALHGEDDTGQENDEESKCSNPGDSCLDTSCCSSAGMQCFKKDAYYAECRYECIPGRNPTSPDKGEWTCDRLGEQTAGEAPTCSKGGEDCTNTGCCAEAGMQCFEKMEGAWATCKPGCTPGLDLSDNDNHPWSCKPLGPVAPNVAQWVYELCAAPHASCAEAGCCSTPGMQCFLHDEYYGECMEECNTEGWDCTPKGYRTPIPAPPASDAHGPVADWVAKECAKDGDNCKKSTCCVQDGMQCFAKNSTFGACKSSCDAGGPDLYDADDKPWSCKVLGPRTPGYPSEPWERRKDVSEWATEKCGEQYSESCSESHCCKTAGDRCFAKDKDWATCMPECTPGPHKGDESGGDWSCEALGPQTHRAFPSLFCFHVLQATGPEPGLVGASMGTGAGIWECDKYALFCASEITVGEGEFAQTTNVFEPAEVVQSKDGTAGNAQLFMNVWKAVRDQGMYKEADWTIKVDPDAVLIPFRLRKHLDAFHDMNGYVVNCAKPYMPEGPMMFGALEAISRSALETYIPKMEDCKTGLPWQKWGEDLFMGKCLEKIGVNRLNDWQIYSDGVCRGVDCGDPVAAAFHPMKDPDSWRACLEQTRHPHGSSGDMDADAPAWFKDYMKTYR